MILLYVPYMLYISQWCQRWHRIFYESDFAFAGSCHRCDGRDVRCHLWYMMMPISGSTIVILTVPTSWNSLIATHHYNNHTKRALTCPSSLEGCVGVSHEWFWRSVWPITRSACRPVSGLLWADAAAYCCPNTKETNQVHSSSITPRKRKPIFMHCGS